MGTEASASIWLKSGVKLDKLTPQMALGANIVAQVFASLGYRCVITSGSDGEHMRESKHGTGEALDFRTKHVASDDKQRLLVQVRARLGREYDVLLEHLEGDSEHLHVEYDPK